MSGPVRLPDWEDLADVAPKVAATMRRYLYQLACVPRPGSVSGADLALRALSGVAANWQGRIDQEIEPIGGFLNLRATLGPDHAIVVTARHKRLHIVGCFCKCRPWRRDGKVIRLIAKDNVCLELPAGSPPRPCRCAYAPADLW